MNSCKLLIFADLHYEPAENDEFYTGVKRKLTQYSKSIMETLIKKINQIKPDVAINLGDLIQNLHNHDIDICNFKYICNVMKKIEVPYYVVTGNHDLLSMSRKEVDEILGYKNSTFSVNINGYHLVILGLDATVETPSTNGKIVKPRKISEKDLEWLKDDIKTNKLPSIVFLHYGIAEDDLKGNWWFEHNIEGGLLQNRNELKTILKTDKNLLAVFSGHQHWTKTIIEDNIPYYILGSLTEDSNFTGVPDAVWFEVDLKDKEITITEHQLDFNEIKQNIVN